MRQQLVQLGNGAHALAFQILGNADDAADAVQDSFARVLAKPERYDASRGALKPWFMRVVRNRCLDMLRGRKPDDVASATLSDSGDSPEDSLNTAQLSDLVTRALASLPPDKREVIVLRDYLDLSYAEIAVVLDIAPGTVMSRLHRARLTLRNTLKTGDEIE